MKISHYISKLAINNVIKKKNRSVLSLVSVMLSSSIIFISLTLFMTVFSLSKSLNSEQTGSAHYYFISDQFDLVDPFQYQVSYLSTVSKNGFCYYQQDDKAEIFHLQAGTLPTSKNEILASLDTGKSIGEEIENYQICGLFLATDFLSQNVGEVDFLSIDPNFDSWNHHYFVHDSRIQDEVSLSAVASLASLDEGSITLNDERITNDTISNYLQDTSTILGMFIVIIVVAVIMCIVSIYNVLIVSDQDRRKEIGLLKSVGVTSKELKYMLILELASIGLVGSIVGIIIGIFVSFCVLQSVTSHLKIVFEWAYVLNPWNILASMASGILLMVISGYLLYHHYFNSKPISDLKGEPVEYDIPYDANRFSISSVTWQMFVIYNERIKKQTRNLRRSFFLVMLTITLFCGIWFSNLLYQNNYQSVKNDLTLSQAHFVLGDKTLYPNLEKVIYEASADENLALSSVVFDRSIIGLKFYTPMDTFTDYYLQVERGDYSTKKYNGTTWNTTYHNGIVLDEIQLNELKDYVVAGSLEDLDEDSSILIYYQYGYYTQSTPTRTWQTGDQVMCENIDQSKPIPPQFFDVDAVIELPYREIELKYSYVDDYQYSIAFTPESFEKLYGPTLSLRYNAEMVLENASNHLSLNHYLSTKLNELGLQDDLQITNYIQIKNDGQFAVFLIEVLLYPLFFMLVIIGIININNVLKGNIHMKRTDFSTMKSVGMTSSQLRIIMVYEYAENYLNAGAITFLLCIPVYILERFFSVASTFRIGDNFAGMFIMSFAILSPVVIFSLAALSFRQLNKITALDGMKDVT